MSNLSGVFHIMLDKKSIPKIIQNKIFQYALTNNDFILFEKLLNIKNIDHNIDKEISKIKNTNVRYAWLSRAGRSKAEIIALLKSEKRKKLINSLINDKPGAVNLINGIIETTSNVDILYSISNGQQFSKSSRNLASEKLLSYKIIDAREYLDSIESYQAQELINLFDGNDKFLSKYSNETAPTILFAKSWVTKLSDEDEDRVFDILCTQSLEKLKGKHLSYYSTKPIKNLIEFTYNSLHYSKVSVENYEKLQFIFNKVLKTSALSFYFEEINLLNKIIELSDKYKMPLIEYGNTISRPSDFNEFIDNLLDLFSKHNANDTFIFEKIMRNFLDNKLLSKVNYGKLLKWYPSDYVSIKKAAKKLGSLDTEKQAYLMLHSLVNYEYEPVDVILKLFSNPERVYKDAINILVRSNEYNLAIEAMISSKYLSKDCLSKFSFTKLALITDTDNSRYSDILQSIIEDIVDDENSWLNFVNLANEFEGSLSEFIVLSKRL
jgi:hypothetical protein